MGKLVHVSIRLPEEWIKEINEVVADKPFAYKDRTDFIKEAILFRMLTVHGVKLE